MMSPDPSRTFKHPNTQNNQDLETVDGIDNTIDLEDDDDIMGTGEHILDYSSQPESWTSEDENSNENGPVEANVENIRRNAHYTMLVPFYVVTEDGNSEINNIPNTTTVQEVNYVLAEEHSTSPTSLGCMESAESSSAQLEANKNETDQEKRDIYLNETKVAEIKDAMKLIKLPDAAIPPWAKDLNEETWKSKLLDKSNKK